MLSEVTQNPFLKKDHAVLRELLLKQIPHLSNCPVDAYLSLAKYFRKKPWTFFCQDSYKAFFAWLEAQDSNGRGRLQIYIKDNVGYLNSALRHLDEVDRYSWHDVAFPKDDMDVVRFLDQSVHPSYIRLCEAVWNPLLRTAAHFSRLNRGKGVEGLDAFNVADELKDGPLAITVCHFRPTIRNAIAHGDTEFRDLDIWYRDKRGNQESLTGREMIRLCDDLLDTCNGIALGLAAFLLSRQAYGYLLPQQLLFEELRAQTACSWWNVDACIPAVRLDHTQLTIYVWADTYDRTKAEYSAFQTGILAGLLAPGYDRYFLSIRSTKARIALAAFKGKEIEKLRMLPNCCIEDCGNIIDDGLFGYEPRIRLPRILQILNTFLISFRVHWPHFLADMQKRLGRPRIVIRETKVHRNGWRCVVNGQILVQFPGGEEEGKDIIRRFKRRIIKRAFKVAKMARPRWSILRYLPLGYARIAIFGKDYRRRRLSGFGLGSDLICTVQMKRIGRIKAPDISGSSVEEHGRYRIAWNRAWLEEQNAA